MPSYKILYISPVGYFKGGAERSLMDLISNPAVTPVVVVPEAGPIMARLQEQGIACHIVPFGAVNTVHRPFTFRKGLAALRAMLHAARTINKLAKIEQVLAVHSNGLKAHVINCAARVLGGKPAIVHIRDIPLTRQERLVWRLLQLACTRMILVSKACWISDTLPSNVSVIHNGTPLLSTTDTGKPLSVNPLRIGFLGRIHPVKGLHLLLNWVHAARLQGLNVYLDVRGTYQDAPTYEAEIQEQISRLGLNDCVIFRGFIDDLAKVYEGLDIVAVPSSTPDPLPRAVMEAMARSIPVIGYPAGGIVDMIDDGITGYLARDATDFNRAIAALLANPDSYQAMLAAGRDKITSTFSIPALHRNIAALYADIAKS